MALLSSGRPDAARNRTGAKTHIEPNPQQRIETRRDLSPFFQRKPPGTSRELTTHRADFNHEGEALGSQPGRLPLLLDKLGERLQFERVGVRLYEALIGKREQLGDAAIGQVLPTVSELQRIGRDELQHFFLLRDIILELGGDPTMMTPSADVVVMLGNGLVQVLTDPRTSFKQCLQAILAAELQDGDGWQLLIEVTRTTGRIGLVAEFEAAHAQELEHLDRVRKWLQAALACEQPRPHHA